VVIPCDLGGVIQYVKVRRPAPPLSGPKYQQVKGGRPALFGLDKLAGRRVVVICEGELDAVLLWQEAGDLVDVVAIGSKTARPALPQLGRLAGAARWLVALDRDADDAAEWWGGFSTRVRRVRSLQGNDLTDFAQAGGNLRQWIGYNLERLERETAPTPAPIPSPPPVQTAGADWEERAEALLADSQAEIDPAAWARRWAALATVEGWACWGFDSWTAWAEDVEEQYASPRF